MDCCLTSLTLKDRGDTQLSCGLEDYELELLRKLYSGRNFTINSSSNLLRLRKGYLRRYNRDVKEIAKDLANRGYITQKTKKDPKYYISNRQLTENALRLHNSRVVLGRVVRIT